MGECGGFNVKASNRTRDSFLLFCLLWPWNYGSSRKHVRTYSRCGSGDNRILNHPRVRESKPDGPISQKPLSHEKARRLEPFQTNFKISRDSSNQLYTQQQQRKQWKNWIHLSHVTGF
jgi:hypothetical protein